MEETCLAATVEFADDTAYRKFTVARHGDEVSVQMHTIWDMDGSETITVVLLPLSALGPLASVLQRAMWLPPNVL